MSHPSNKKRTDAPAEKNSGRVQTKRKTDYAKANRIMIIAALVFAIALVISVGMKVMEDTKAEQSAQTLLEAYKQKQEAVATAPTPEPTAAPTQEVSNNSEPEPAVLIAENGETPRPEATQTPEDIEESESIAEEGQSNRYDAENDEHVDETADYVQPDRPDEEDAEALIEQIINAVGDDGVIGLIEIPKTGQEYPVIGKWSYKLLKISICRYRGPSLNEKGNVVLIGHNYKSGAHFGQLKNLEVGDEIFLTAAGSDLRVRYEVYNIVDIEPDNFAALKKTKGETCLTLMTCTSSGNKRKLLRCVKKAATSDSDILTDMRDTGYSM